MSKGKNFVNFHSVLPYTPIFSSNQFRLNFFALWWKVNFTNFWDFWAKTKEIVLPEIWYGFIRSATWKRIYSLTTSVLDLCALWLQNLRRLLVLGLFWLSISHFWLNWMIFVYKWHLKPFLAPLSNFGVKGYTFSLEKSETKTGCLHGKNHKFKYFAGKSHSRSLRRCLRAISSHFVHTHVSIAFTWNLSQFLIMRL